MMNSRYVDGGIERILQLSADARIRRRDTAKNSPAFHKLSAVITAYGEALALLTGRFQHPTGRKTSAKQFAKIIQFVA